MCRNEIALGVALIAFGMGLLLCCFIETVAIRVLMGFGAVVGGCCILRR